METLARVASNRPAFIQGDRRLTWDEFNKRCNQIANSLSELGVKKEDCVAIMGFNSIEWMESYFAASKIGAVPVNLNPRFVKDEIIYVLEDSDSVAVFVEDEYAKAVKEIQKDLPLLKHVIVYGIGKEPKEVPSGAIAYSELIKGPDHNPEVEVFNDDFCFLMYTGGTTGWPKGVVWDGEQRAHGLDMLLFNSFIPITDRLGDFPDVTLEHLVGMLGVPGIITPIVLAGREIFRYEGFKEVIVDTLEALFGTQVAYRIIGGKAKLLIASPLFHGAGYEANFSLMGALGITSVYPTSPHPFNPRECWETVEREKVNVMLIVGDAFAIPLLDELKRAEKEGRQFDTSSLWGMISSGVRWSAYVKKGLQNYVPGLITLDEMGTTESSAAFTELSTSMDKERKLAGAYLPHLRGGIYKHQYPCRVINPATGEDVEPGSEEVGEFIYGGWMALGYWKCPNKTAQDFRMIDGKRWFFVGDDGTVDSEGKFHLIGRGGAYMINTGGEKVYSEEVEGIIKGYHKIRDVAVIGIPDEKWGEAVTVVIELFPGEEATHQEIIEYCKGKVSGYKKPRHVVFVDKVPRSASGKIAREEAKKMAFRSLGIKG